MIKTESSSAVRLIVMKSSLTKGEPSSLELLIHEGRVWLRDLGSTKGTSIDGERAKRPVEAGVRVAMGPVEFTLAVSEITASDQLRYERLGRLEDYRHLIRPEADHRLPEVPIPHPSYRASGKWVKPGLPPKVKRLRWISVPSPCSVLLVAAIMIQESDKPVIIQALKVNFSQSGDQIILWIRQCRLRSPRSLPRRPSDVSKPLWVT